MVLSVANMSHSWTIHSLRHVALRILSSPAVAWAQLTHSSRGKSGLGSTSPTLPLYADDSQGKRAKSKTLVTDLLLFLLLLCLLVFLFTRFLPSASILDPEGERIGDLSADGTEMLVEVNDDIDAIPEARRREREEKAVHDASTDEAGVEPGASKPPTKAPAVATAAPTNPAPAAESESLVSKLTGKLKNLARRTGVTSDTPTDAQSITPIVAAVSDEENASRREAVKQAFKHAWGGYTTYSFGHDEVRPVSNETNDSWGGWGATLIDGLDTAMIMGLEEEVARARAHVATLDFNRDFVASFFETTIRYLGGLLGAFELSRDELYLTKATQLADLLLAGFDASPTGIPKSKINLAKHTSENQRWAGGHSILAEVGSIQLEFAYLSYHTGNPVYNKKARHVFTLLEQAPKDIPGLYPTYLDPNTGEFTNTQISFGSFGDSFYEYLLKLYLLTDRRDQGVLRMYNQAMEAMEMHMIESRKASYVEPLTGMRRQDQFSFLGELSGSHYTWKMEHLTCFLPGLLALGTSLFTDSSFRKEFGWQDAPAGEESNRVRGHKHDHTIPGPRRNGATENDSTGDSTILDAPLTVEEKRLQSLSFNHTHLSTSLLRTCLAGYTETSTGLAPESIGFDFRSLPPERKQTIGAGGKKKSIPWTSEDLITVPDNASLLGHIFRVEQSKYILRPETIESIFVHWRLTKDPYYREVGWRIFQNLKRTCQTRTAFSGIRDVNKGFGKGEVPVKGKSYIPREQQTLRADLYSDEENWTNSQESFFFAETLKYFYLLFSDDDVIPLDSYVFNTEAHPLGILVDHSHQNDDTHDHVPPSPSSDERDD